MPRILVLKEKLTVTNSVQDWYSKNQKSKNT